MELIPNSQIRLNLSVYGFDPSDSQCEAIRHYVSLLLRWNKIVSLTAVTGVDKILRFHFGESLFALKHVPIENGRLADVGAGAGFPGIALKIGQPVLKLTLLEPNQKKATFLREVARELHLENIEVLRARFEALSREAGPFEYITVRALGSHKEVVRFADSFLSSSGSLILWLGSEDTTVVKSLGTLGWRDPIKIPKSEGRFLLVGSKE